MSGPGSVAMLDLQDVSSASAEDRIAMMKAVKDGLCSIDEIVAQMKAQAITCGSKSPQAERRASKQLAKANKRPSGYKARRKSQGGIGRVDRQGGLRKARGRLNLDVRLEKSGDTETVVVELKSATELSTNKYGAAPNVYIKCFLMLDCSEKPVQMKRTTTHKGTSGPQFDEGWCWELAEQTDFEESHVVIQCWDDPGLLRRARFLGGMSFNLARVADTDDPCNGWYKLLSAPKAMAQNVRWWPTSVSASKLTRPLPSLPPSPPAAARRRRSSALPNVGAEAPASQATAASAATPSLFPKQRQPRARFQTPPERAETTIPSAAEPPVEPAAAAVPMPTVTVGKAEHKALDRTVGIDSFNYLQVIGQGSFGQVLLAELKGVPEQTFAVKILKKAEVLDDDDVEATMTEKRVLALSNECRFLTRVFATFQSPEKLCYVMEFLPGGDLMHHIQNRTTFPTEDTRFYTAEIALGLWFLHGRGVLYRDLKLDNVMLSADGHIRIADFGMCKEGIFAGDTTATFCGTPGYLAPEIIREEPYDGSVDWWSLGVMVYEMLVGESPFDADDESELFELILSAEVTFTADISRESQSVITGLLTRDPAARLGCGGAGENNIRYHPFFTGLDWAKLESGGLEPPFLPQQQADARDVSNFDTEFTGAQVSIGKGQSEQPQGLGNEFEGFEFVDASLHAHLDAAATAAVGGGSSAVAAAAAPLALEDYGWFRSDLSRSQTIEELNGAPAGTFVVRKSSSQADSWALSVSIGSKKPWNGLISMVKVPGAANIFRLFDQDQFSSIAAVVHHYQKTPIAVGKAKDLCLCL
jgi:serine/threonine protein kinase